MAAFSGRCLVRPGWSAAGVPGCHTCPLRGLAGSRAALQVCFTSVNAPSYAFRASLQTTRLGVQIIPFRTPQRHPGEGRVTAHIGGSRSSFGNDKLPSGRWHRSWAVRLAGRNPPGEVLPASAARVTARLPQRRRRRCRWHAGPGCRERGRTASWCADQRVTRPPAPRAAVPRHPARR